MSNFSALNFLNKTLDFWFGCGIMVEMTYQIPIEKIYRQETPYSCCAAALQTIFHYHDARISHKDAILLLNINEDGGYFIDVARACSKYLKTRYKTLKTISQIEKYIFLGNIVIAADNVTYQDAHAVLIVGFDSKNFSILDPNTAKITFWDKNEFFEQSDEFIVIFR